MYFTNNLNIRMENSKHLNYKNENIETKYLNSVPITPIFKGKK